MQARKCLEETDWLVGIEEKHPALVRGVVGWVSGATTLLILWIVGLITPLQVKLEDEETALDISEHSESAYND